MKLLFLYSFSQNQAKEALLRKADLVLNHNKLMMMM